MQTQDFVQSPAAAYPGARSIDPINAQIMARYARQEAILGMLGGLGRAVAKIVGSWHQRRAVYRELTNLPDHLLSDIGIRRDQISAVAFRSLRREPSALAAAVGTRAISFFEPKPVAAAPAASPDAHTPLAA